MSNLFRKSVSSGSAEAPTTRPKSEWQKAVVGVTIAPLFLVGYGLFHQASKGLEGEPKNRQFACMSSLDGSMFELAYEAKQGLRDPDSFEHIQSSATVVDVDGRQRIRMRFRARNGFGGMNVETAEAVVSNRDCKLLSWSYSG